MINALFAELKEEREKMLDLFYEFGMDKTYDEDSYIAMKATEADKEYNQIFFKIEMHTKAILDAEIKEDGSSVFKL